VGYVPQGLAKYTGIWKAPLPDYSIGSGDSSLVHQSGYYMVTGLFGATVTYLVMYLLSTLIIRRGK